jgi:hypothetical protein
MSVVPSGNIDGPRSGRHAGYSSTSNAEPSQRSTMSESLSLITTVLPAEAIVVGLSEVGTVVHVPPSGFM